MPQNGEQEPISVDQLTRQIKDVLTGTFRSTWVTGEISGYRGPHSSGHVYCTLKDAKSQIPLILWRSTVQRLRFRLEEGMEVNVRGEVDVYPPRGAYQLIAKSIEPKGIGSLQLAFRQLLEKLHDEGLFDDDRKQLLPRYPRTIGIVTAATGAAARDMVRILKRRDPRVRVIIYPARVQREGAKESIADGIAFFNAQASRPEVDLIIAGRGGGSLEDLWAFNEELVARAIAASELPIISAVGHEIDTTIADYVADVRAATPSEAAEIAVPELVAMQEYAGELDQRMRREMRTQLENARERTHRLRQRVHSHSPQRLLAERAQTLDLLGERLHQSIRYQSESWRERVSGLARNLESLSPLRVLGRGYSVARFEDGRVVRSTEDVAVGDGLSIRVGDGSVETEVTGTTQTERLVNGSEGSNDEAG